MPALVKEKENYNFSLIYKSKDYSYNIAFFKTKDDAEHWKHVLAFITQEYNYDEMEVHRRNVTTMRYTENKDAAGNCSYCRSNFRFVFWIYVHNV